MSYRLRLVAAFFAIYIIWGSSFLGIKWAIDTIPPFLMGALRFLSAGAIVYGLARLSGAPGPRPREWLPAGIVGMFLFLGGNGGVTWATQRVPTGLVALMVAIVPVWMVLLEWLRPGGQRPERRVIVGLVLGVAGALLLISPGSLGEGQSIDPLGAVSLLISSVGWSVGSIFASRVRTFTSPWLITGMQMLVGGVCLLGASLVSGELSGFHPLAISLRSVLALAYIVIFGAVLGYTAYFWLLQVTTPAIASTYAFVNPLVAVYLGWAILGEVITLRMLMATAAISLAVILITLYGSKRQPQRTTKPAQVVLTQAHSEPSKTTEPATRRPAA